MKPRRSLILSLVAIAVLGIGVLVAFALIWTAPATKTEDKTRALRNVQTIRIEPRSERITVTAYGPVIPAQRVIVKPEVHGRVIEQHASLVPGGYVEAGEQLIRIDPAEYELALTEQETALEEARFELDVEQGRQVVASREWKLLEDVLTGSDVNRSLVLREPHLRRIEAMLRQATNEIAKAKLDLSRTVVPAPFNAMVLDEFVEVGQLVESGTAICTLVGTDNFWVQATLPLDKLQRIRLPGPDRTGAEATVYLDTGNGKPAAWRGRVERLLSDLETSGRMARVLVSVPDPLALNSEGRLPLLLGSYVRVEIDAGELTDVLSVPRAALREGDRIWVMDANSELQIRDAEILWTRPESVLIANTLKPGEELIVSGLRTALPGMKVTAQPAASSETVPAAGRTNS